LARRAGDPAVLGLNLSRCWSFLDYSTPQVEASLALNREAEAVAEETNDPVAVCSALRGLAFASACRGDGEQFAEHLGAGERSGDRLRRPRLSWIMRSDRAALAIFRGEPDRAEQLAMEAFGLAQEAHVDDATAISQLGAVLYHIRQAQGRLGEMVPL